MKKWMILLFASIITLLAFRNFSPITVTGIVTDQQNNPVAGATVTEIGSGNTTITSKAGKFSITVGNASARLLISFLGFESLTININAGKSMHIRLQAAA